ncbi:hypothetical protein [uncultured Shewanella sp.]|uniref:ATP-binding protein n=1 Tax=uncultured Shewanella sp. TaxID=173975 RepID=UPI00262568AD|nr:hypothetical protein [uncultured Shewanella sp.]
MIDHMGLTNKESKLGWNPLSLSESQLIPLFSEQKNYKFFKVNEISEGKSAAYRLAMANVIGTLRNQSCSLVYLMSSEYGEISLYLGVVSASDKTDIYECGETIKSAFEGNFLGAKITALTAEDQRISTLLNTPNHVGYISGIPSFNENESAIADLDFQGIERIANSLVDEKWQLMIVAEAMEDDDILEWVDSIYQMSTDLSSEIKHSIQNGTNKGRSKTKTTGTSDSKTDGSSNTKSTGWDESGSETKNQGKETKSNGKNGSKADGTSNSTTKGTNESDSDGESNGSSESITQERVNKKAEEIQTHLIDNLLPRFRLGLSKGMFKTAIYVSAQNKAPYERLTSSVLSIFQGNQSTMTPLQLHRLSCKDRVCLQDYLLLRTYQLSAKQQGLLDQSQASVYSMSLSHSHLLGATILNSEEISLVAGLPSKELPGFKIRKSVDFGLNMPQSNSKHLVLGNVIQNGRLLTNKPLTLPIADLSKHIFISGVTGSGKTTTCMKILLESQLPFLVIEPAKTEYRALHQQCKDIEFYCIGNEKLTPFRLNPFQLSSSESSLMGHISVLKATLIASFPMEAAMPSIVEEAIIKAYQNKGWDIYSNENYLFDAPFSEGSMAWPTFSDMIEELDGIIKSKGMGREFEEKYQGSLVARLTSLTLGIKGRMLNTRFSMDFDRLLDKQVVIELEELKDEQDKSFFMGLFISRLAECMKARHKKNPDFQHITLIEEAHRLLSRPEAGDPESKKLGVTMFTDLLSEVRKYGEGLIIADQSPTKLVADVIKNTNTKVVHRLLDTSDRNVIGDAMSLEDNQKDFLQHLQPGETIIYSGGWHAPIRTQVKSLTNTNGADIPKSVITSRGYHQLWAQKQAVMPHTTSQLSLLDTPAKLGGWLQSGVGLLNLYLRINQEVTNEDAVEQVNNMQIRFQNQYQQVMSDVELSADEVSIILANLFMDNAVFKWSEQECHSNKKPLARVFQALSISIDAFREINQERVVKAIYDDKEFSVLTAI